MLTVVSSNCTVIRQITLNLSLTSAVPDWYQKEDKPADTVCTTNQVWRLEKTLNTEPCDAENQSHQNWLCMCPYSGNKKEMLKKKEEIKNEREAFSGWLLWNVCLAVERNILSARIVFCIRNCASLCNDPCTVWLIDDRLSYIALFSTLLSRLTAFTCGSTWVTSLL